MSSKSTSLGTAVITGASAGIGKRFADQLAGKGFDLFLVARRRDRLDDLANELRRRYSVGVTTHVSDLGSSADLEELASKLAADESVSMLVNNAGTSSLGPLESATTEQLYTLVNLNVIALTRLCMAVLPGFKARNQGVIVNIGSVIGFDGYPYNAIYGGTKAYVQNLTLALQAELKDTDLKVQLVTPAATVSEIWDVMGYPLSNLDQSVVMSTEDLVDGALLGLDQGERVTAPSIEDAGLVEQYLQSGAGLLRAAQTGQLATRYARH